MWVHAMYHALLAQPWQPQALHSTPLTEKIAHTHSIDDVVAVKDKPAASSRVDIRLEVMRGK